jgi:hypothetical protein
MKISVWCLVLSIVSITSSDNGACVTGFAPIRFATHRSSKERSPVRSLVLKESPSQNDNEHGMQTLPSMFPFLASSLNNLGFSTPTPIQSASGEMLGDNNNLLLIAPTGSGKTLAYLLPALSKALQTNSTVLVVAPTRELAVQLLRDARGLLSNRHAQQDEQDDDDEEEEIPIVLAVRGVPLPAPDQLNNASLLIGTPLELLQMLTSIKGGLDFIAGDVLSSIILDEVDVLLPNSPKILRTSLDKGNRNDKNGKKANTPQDERRRQEQKRKLMAAKRKGIELSSGDNKKEVSLTEKLLKLVATRRFAGGDELSSPIQIIAGSATASRKTLDRLNRALRDAAGDASSTYQDVWNGDIKACRPAIISSSGADKNEAGGLENEEQQQQQQQQQHTIRAVTVPQEVKHQFIMMEKEPASSASVVLATVAKAAAKMKPSSALVFICGEFGKTNVKEKQEPKPKAKGATYTSRRNQSLKSKRMAAEMAQKAKGATTTVLSARQVCSTLAQYGVEAQVSAGRITVSCVSFRFSSESSPIHTRFYQLLFCSHCTLLLDWNCTPKMTMRKQRPPLFLLHLKVLHVGCILMESKLSL